MNRTARFFRNNGVVAAIQCAIVGIIVFYSIRKDIASGLWVITLPLVLAGFLAGYPIRNWLVDNVKLTRILMNSVAIGAVIILVLVGKLEGEEPAALRIGLSAGIGLYMGLYFWLMSDERISTQ